VIEDRYPDADVLGERGHWDGATRRVVLDRVHNPPPFRNLDPRQQATLEALCARVLPQQHRPPEFRVPLASWIDQHVGANTLEGFQFEDMPSNRDCWIRGLAGLDQTAQALWQASFAELSGDRQDAVLNSIRAGDPPGEVWQHLPAKRWWVYTAVRQISGIYYAHPYAWDEIGFGGPAYPRGYFALSFGAPEPWEAREAPANDRERGA
jgi:hypothetical protein